MVKKKLHEPYRVVVSAGKVHDLNVLHDVDMALLCLLEKVRHVLRDRLEVERQLGRRHKILAVGVVAWIIKRLKVLSAKNTKYGIL